MLQAVQYVGPAAAGSTSPQLFYGDDENLYVVKLQNNRLGKKILVNELISSELGDLLGLCFPPSGPIVISQQLINTTRWLRHHNVHSGIHFASRYIAHAKILTPGRLQRAINARDLAGVMLFDHLFYNFDRIWNRKNLLAVCEGPGMYRIFAIDHSHLFLRGRWNEAILVKLQDKIRIEAASLYRFSLQYVLETYDFEQYLRRCSYLTASDIAGILARIPAEWLPQVDERQALLVFACRRLALAEQVVGELQRLIPNKHGCSQRC